jgi:imidazolonepropionase-like amidohydrolase
MTIAPNGPLVFDGATVIDGSGAAPLAGGVVVVEGERVSAIGPAGAVRIPDGATVLPCRGLTLLPGLIDAHTHLAEDGYPSALRRLKETAAFAAIRSGVHAARVLEAGFTTVRDLGSFGLTDVATKRAIEAGLIRGPRMVVAAHMLVPSGSEEDGYFRPEVRTYRVGPERGVADGANGLRQAVRLQLHHGADLIKIVASGRIFSDAPGGPWTPTFSEEELRAVCDEAHRHGAKVAAHAFGADCIRLAVQAGVDSIEHGGWIDGELARLMAARGTFLVPTFSLLNLAAEHGSAGGVPAPQLARVLEIRAAHLESFGRAAAAGVRIAAGTDCGNPQVFPGRNATELAYLVEAGLSPLAAMHAATGAAADLLGLESQVGRLAPGMLADLVLVAGDPLAEIGCLVEPERIKLVLKGGEVQAAALPAPEPDRPS